MLRISNKHKTEDEIIFVSNYQINEGILLLLIEESLESTSTSYEIFSRINSEKKSTNIQCAIEKIQLLIINKTIRLFEDKFSLEENMLALSYQMLNSFDDALSFSALILYLLDKNFKASDIISSGLIHNYFMRNFFSINEITKTYTLIRLYENEKKLEKNELLHNIATIKADGELYESYALNGALIPDNKLSTYKTKTPVYDENISIENGYKITSILGPPFILLALSYSENENANLFLTQLIENLNNKLLFILFNHINLNVSSVSGQRSRVLMSISHYLNEDATITLLEKTNVSIWSILYSKSNILSGEKKEVIHNLIKKQSININEIDNAYKIANNYTLSFLKNDIYLKIFYVFLAAPSIYSELKFKRSPGMHGR